MAQLPDITTWTEDYLAALPTDEVSWLECKDSRWLTADEAWRQKASPYLSAFANYDGGYLVMGVSDPKNGTGVVSDGGIREDLKPGGIVAWLQDVLPALVDRPLERINVYPIRAGDGTSRIGPGRCVIVVHVPASDGAPHQARDGKYYARHGSRLSVLSHRAISDISGRHQTPRIAVELRLSLGVDDHWYLSVSVSNVSPVVARWIKIEVFLPPLLNRRLITGAEGLVERDGRTCWHRIFRNDTNAPLFPNDTIRWVVKLEQAGSLGLPEELAHDPILTNVVYRAFADQMPLIERELRPSEIVVPG